MNKFKTGDLVRMRGSSKNPVMVVTVEKGAREGVYNCSWWAGGYNHLTLAEHELELVEGSTEKLEAKEETPAPRYVYHTASKQVYCVDKSVGDDTLLRCIPIVKPDPTEALWIDSAWLKPFLKYFVGFLHADVVLAKSPESGVYRVENIRHSDWKRAEFLINGHGWVPADAVRPVGRTA